jgi:hypothetical protein
MEPVSPAVAAWGAPGLPPSGSRMEPVCQSMEEALELGEEAGGGFVALSGCADGFAVLGRGRRERWEEDDEGEEGEDGDEETLGASGHGWTS